jgi:hypothetical protein
VQARHAARTLSAAHGWGHWLAKEVDRALVIARSGHAAGDPIRLSELAAVLRRRGLAGPQTPRHAARHPPRRRTRNAIASESAVSACWEAFGAGAAGTG